MRRRPGGPAARLAVVRRRDYVEMERRPGRDKGRAAGGRDAPVDRPTELLSRLPAVVARLGRQAPCGRPYSAPSPCAIIPTGPT